METNTTSAGKRISDDFIATFTMIRRLPEDAQPAMRKSLFGAIKRAYHVPEHIKLSINLDDTASPLYAVLVDKATGQPWGQKSADTTNVVYRMSHADALAVLRKYGNRTVMPNMAPSSYADGVSRDAQYVYFTER
jgi:hypothetical protein